MPNGIDLILADHRRVDDLFDRFDQTGDANLVGQVICALEDHDDAEQAILYPFAGKVLGDADLINGLAAAHSAVKKQIDYLTTLEGPPLTAAFQVLRSLVLKHVADEERTLLPALAERANPQLLEGLGARILQAKQRVG